LLLLTGPVLLFVGYALHPDLPADAGAAVREVAAVRDTFLGSKLMVAAGSLLMLPLVLAVRARFAGGPGGRLLTVGAALVCLGMASNAMSQTLNGYLLWYASAPGVDATAGTAVVQQSVEAYQSEPLATLPVSFLSVPVFAVGLLVLAAGLWRVGPRLRWASVAIVVVDVAASAIGIGPLMLAVGVLATAAFAAALSGTQASSAVRT
jgi:hypothetical protein